MEVSGSNAAFVLPLKLAISNFRLGKANENAHQLENFNRESRAKFSNPELSIDVWV